MKITYLAISGWDSAIRALYMSLGNYTPELEEKIKISQSIEAYNNLGICLAPSPFAFREMTNPNADWWTEQKRKVVDYGKKHLTLMRYLDVSMTVVGLHRGAQDDFDSHAARFNSRIVRMSTRTKNNTEILEISDYYKGKILPFNELIDICKLPQNIFVNDSTYIRTPIGYVNADYINDKDVRRGNIRLAMSSTFTVKVQMAELCHVFRERNIDSSATPELKDLMEMVAVRITEDEPLITRDYLIECCLQ